MLSLTFNGKVIFLVVYIRTVLPQVKDNFKSILTRIFC